MAFSPGEARDDHGRWTDGGVVAAIENDLLSVGKFTEQQMVELKDYAEGNYQALNGYLYSPSSVESSLAKEYDKQIKTLDAALNKSKLKVDVTVYRGIQSPKVLANAERLIGRTISAPGFQSTSRSIHVARDFASHGTGAVVLELKAKKGTKAVDMERFKTSGNAHEQEILFGHGQNVKITGIDRSQSPPVIKAEFV